jgi:hypothetical protein
MSRTDQSNSSERIVRATSLLVAVGLGAVVLFVGLGACSLGDGVSPDCDGTLGPGEPGSCQQLGVCDDGRGGVLANENCCVEASRQLLEICIQEDLDGDWRGQCQNNAQLSGSVCSVTTSEMDDKTPNVNVGGATEACEMANDVFAHCLAGGLLFNGQGGGNVGGMSPGGGGAGGMNVGGTSAGGAGGAGGAAGGAGGT